MGSSIVRRWLVLAAFAFWLGGFVFYAAVVVPVGKEVLGSDADQGFITRRVSAWINVTAAASLGVFLADLLLPPRSARRGLAALWIAMAAAQVALFVVRPPMDALLDPDAQRILDRSNFRILHKVYLWTHTVQWLFGCVYLALLLRRWRREDQEASVPSDAPR